MADAALLEALNCRLEHETALLLLRADRSTGCKQQAVWRETRAVTGGAPRCKNICTNDMVAIMRRVSICKCGCCTCNRACCACHVTQVAANICHVQ